MMGLQYLTGGNAQLQSGHQVVRTKFRGPLNHQSYPSLT